MKPAKSSSSSSSAFLVIATIILATGATAQRSIVDVSPSTITASEGDTENLLCRIGQQLAYCRIKFANIDRALILSDKVPSSTPGFKYYGEGFAKGQCGVTIDKISAQQNGNMTCYLGTDVEEFVGRIEVLIAQPPVKPELDFNGQDQQYYEAGKEFAVTCRVRNGRPASNLTWYLGDEQITEGLSTPEIFQSVEQNNNTLYSVQQSFRRVLQPEDDGRRLSCRSNHFALSNKFEDISTQIIVRYKPQSSQPRHIYGLVLGDHAPITVQIQANPAPRVRWTVDGFTIEQGQRDDRFEAQTPENLGGGLYNVTLVISSLTLEDTTKHYILHADNELGINEYSIRISSSEAAPEVDMGIGGIIAIAVGIAVIVIIIAVVVIARITGRWCFSGASHRTDIGQDSEAQVAHNYDDEKNFEEFHPTENGQPNSTDITDETSHPEPVKHNGNGTDAANKTNTSV